MRTFIATLWILGLAALVWTVGGKLRRAADARFSILDPPPLAELDTRVVDIVTLGHRGLWDDFINIWALQFLLDPRLGDEDPADVERTLAQVARHRPKIESFYMLSCYTMLFLFEQPGACEGLILEGIRALPQGWRLPVTQGWVYAYEMQNWRQAATYYGLAASRPGAPAFLQSLTARLIERGEVSGTELVQSITEVIKPEADGKSRLESFLGELEELRRKRRDAREGR